MYKIISKTILLLGLIFPAVSFAGVVDINLSPEIPEPNQTISAELSGTLVDLDSSDIYWYLDKEIQKHGIGEKSFSFTAGDVDEKKDLEAIVIIPDGRRIDLQRTIEPTNIDLLWEANTYTPPFYRGKALPTYKSSIKVLALPSGKNINTKFIYNWSIDSLNNIAGSSGYNQKTFTTFGSYAGYSRKINVSMTSFDKFIKAKKTIKIESVAPELVFYENNPLMGTIFNNALYGIREIKSNDFSVKAEPYYVSRGELKNVQYKWGVGKDRVESKDNKEKMITFTKPENGSGKVQVQAHFKNTANTYQEARSGVYLSY